MFALRVQRRLWRRLWIGVLALSLLFLPTGAEAAGLFQKAGGTHEIFLGEVQSYGDTELKKEYFDTFADKLSEALRDAGFDTIANMDMTNEAGRHEASGSADEAALVNALGKGQIDPVLAQHADYICYGYLTMLSNVKAQSGVLVFSGSDKTVYAELSLRVLDTHTHTIVYAGKADSRRKAALSYHAILQRADSGAEDAIRQALSDAAVNLAAQLKEAM